MTLKTLADVREILRHLPEDRRARPTWRHVAAASANMNERRRELRYCIWSSMFEKAALSCRAFLISSALTNGYSPYSRKLGQ